MRGHPVTTQWQLLQLGSPVPETEIRLLSRAQRRLARLVETTIVPALDSGLKHEAGTPRDRATTLVTCLGTGAIAVLANGPPLGGLSAGDAMLTQVLPFLPSCLEGTIVGAMSHAHVLTALVHHHPNLRAFMAPPVVEVLGALEEEELATDAIQQTVALLDVEPPHGRLAPATIRAAAFLPADQAGGVVPPGRSEPLVPTIVRPGRAVGRVIAGNLTAVAWLAGSPAWAPAGILFLEVCELRLVHVDRLLQRLRMLGVLASLDALLIGAPIRLVESVRALSLADIVARALDGTSYPVALNAFVGSGWPSPFLRIGATAEVALESEEISVTWCSPGCPP